ncbi:MAG: putative DNA repair protein YkoV [Firmicutes bacterium ADurb.Bin456]|nr:MAG: putative DNA repair protein YkoV [Firmicutes bacterium ADurb.Bin456]
MRPIWKGAVSFGLVFVPVKLYAATEKKDIRFNYLHEVCKTPVQYKRYCPRCGTEVPMEEIVRGYEYEKGKYIVMQEEDFGKPATAGGKSIEILDFVNLAEIEPIYYEKAYYLAPGDGGARVFELLKQAMLETGKVAVAKVVLRSRETLAAIRASGKALVMSTMFFPDEIRQTDVLPELNYNVQLQANELRMAVDLISSLSSNFQPDKYTDTQREGLMEIIQAKITGEETAAPAKPEAGKVVDLMEALKASIDLAREERGQQDGSTTGSTGSKGRSRRKTS